MRHGEMSVNCEKCGRETQYAARVGANDGTGIRHQPLCPTHGNYVKLAGTVRVLEALVCPTQNIARVDLGRCGGDVECSDCGKKFYDHPRDADFPFLTVLCDGSVAKL